MATNCITVSDPVVSVIVVNFGPAGADGVGIPVGGTTGQTLQKTSATDYDTEWGSGGAGDMLSATYDPATIAEQLVGLVATQTLTNKTLTSPVLNTGVSGTAVLDEDDLATDSDTQLATQQSIKAYVDDAIKAVTIIAKVNEAAGVSIGEVLYISGATGGFPQVSLADNTNFTKADVLAIAASAGSNGQNVSVTLSGSVEGFDTSAFTEGDILYLGTTGSLTATHPTGIDAVQRIGHAVKINASTGSILVELDGLTVINNHNGIMRHQLVNQNAGTSASSAYTIVNDASHRSSFSMVGSNYNVVAGITESLIIYNEGYNKTVNAVDGNFGFEWWTDVTDSHNLSSTSKMSLSAAGNLAVTGTVTGSNLSGTNTGDQTIVIPIIGAASDETTALTTGTAKLTFRMPYAFTLTDVRASLVTAPTGSTLTVDINETAVSILSTKLTIDATEKTSTTAATPPVISDTSLADDAEITVDIDAVGATIAGAGLKVTLIGTKT